MSCRRCHVKTRKLFLFISLLVSILSSSSIWAQTDRPATRAELQDMLKDPDRFHKEVQDITQGHPRILGMTSEMVLFYTAVAIVEAKNCFLKEDPTGCTLFAESMKDPAGHIGFMSFMFSAHKSAEWVTYMSKGKLPKYVARNVGLMVGMMVQDTLIEFVKNPNTQELLALPGNRDYPTIREKYERAKILKNNLWNETYGNADWRMDKGIQGLSLLAAVALTSGTQLAIKETAKRTIPKIGLELGKRIWVGSRFVRVATPVGLAVTGIIIFLEWSGMTEKYIAQPLREGYARTRLQANASQLTANLIRGATSDEEEFQKLADETADRFVKYRTALLHESLATYYGHQKTLSEISQRFFTVTQYTSWLTEGMDTSTYYENEGGWHDEKLVNDLYYDRGRYFEGVFCGGKAVDSISMSLDFHGIPLPMITVPYRPKNDFIDDFLRNRGNVRDIHFSPYKVISYPNTCFDSIQNLNRVRFPDGSISDNANVYCPVKKEGGRWKQGRFWYTNYWGCKFHVKQYRQHLLYERQSWDTDLAEKLVEGNLASMTPLLSRTQVLRLDLIKRYEKNVRLALLKGLSGRKVTIASENSTAVLGSSESRVMVVSSYVPKGAVPVLTAEEFYWKTQIARARTDNIRNILEKKLEGAQMQKQYALELIEFMKKPFSSRDRSEDLDLMFSDADWAHLARFYKQFVLN